jgi:hypothetical protein
VSAAAAITNGDVAVSLPPKPPEPYWDLQNRKLLLRARAASPDWPYTKYGPIPQECITVDGAHSPNQQRIIEYLREKLRLKTGKLQGVIRISLLTISRELKMRLRTVQRNLIVLAAKRSLRVLTLRTRGEKGEANREATAYVIPTHVEVLEARRNDPLIGTTHGDADRSKSRQWTNGRRDSRRLLTPEEIELWGCAKLPAKPGAPAPAKHEPPPEADADRAAPQPAMPPAAATDVPETVQDKLETLCRLAPGYRPNTCDIGSEVVSVVYATAAERQTLCGTDDIVAVLQWVHDRAPRQRRDVGSGAYVIERTVVNWPGYIRVVLSDTAHAYFNDRDGAAKRNVAAAANALVLGRERVFTQLANRDRLANRNDQQAQRQREDVQALLDGLRKDFPSDYARWEAEYRAPREAKRKEEKKLKREVGAPRADRAETDGLIADLMESTSMPEEKRGPP